jgi:hypothetical protein
MNRAHYTFLSLNDDQKKIVNRLTLSTLTITQLHCPLAVTIEENSPDSQFKVKDR